LSSREKKRTKRQDGDSSTTNKKSTVNSCKELEGKASTSEKKGASVRGVSRVNSGRAERPHAKEGTLLQFGDQPFEKEERKKSQVAKEEHLPTSKSQENAKGRYCDDRVAVAGGRTQTGIA